MPLTPDEIDKLVNPEQKDVAIAERIISCRDDYFQSREEVRDLQWEYLKSIYEATQFGYSNQDIAFVLDITKQRVSQLLKDYFAQLGRMHNS